MPRDAGGGPSPASLTRLADVARRLGRGLRRRRRRRRVGRHPTRARWRRDRRASRALTAAGRDAARRDRDLAARDRRRRQRSDRRSAGSGSRRSVRQHDGQHGDPGSRGPHRAPAGVGERRARSCAGCVDRHRVDGARRPRRADASRHLDRRSRRRHRLHRDRVRLGGGVDAAIADEPLRWRGSDPGTDGMDQTRSGRAPPSSGAVCHSRVRHLARRPVPGPLRRGDRRGERARG